MTAAELIHFEDDIAASFERGEIRAWIHLASGNAGQLMEIFRDIRPEDWVLASWRSHWHCLLKGVPPQVVKAAILAGNSISLCFPEYRVLSSGIVGGTAPIAVGLAEAIKRSGGEERVYCFVGDMTAETGIFYESVKYATNKRLPVQFIVEDNWQSVYTDTWEAWGSLAHARFESPLMRRYRYRLGKWPHSGIGKRVEF